MGEVGIHMSLRQDTAPEAGGSAANGSFVLQTAWPRHALEKPPEGLRVDAGAFIGETLRRSLGSHGTHTMKEEEGSGGGAWIGKFPRYLRSHSEILRAEGGLL